MDPTLITARIMEEWQVSEAEMAKIIECESIVGKAHPPAGEWELEREKRFKLVLRLYQSLGALLGHETANIASWLRTKNLDFAMCPIDLMQTEAGLRALCDYADGYRSKS